MRFTRLLLAAFLFTLLASCMVPMPQHNKSGATYGPPTAYKPYTYTPMSDTSRSRTKSSSGTTWYHTDGSTSQRR